MQYGTVPPRADCWPLACRLTQPALIGNASDAVHDAVHDAVQDFNAANDTKRDGILTGTEEALTPALEEIAESNEVEEATPFFFVNKSSPTISDHDECCSGYDGDHERGHVRSFGSEVPPPQGTFTEEKGFCETCVT